MRANIARGIAIAMIFGGLFTPLLALQGQSKPVEKININTAPVEVLENLPRIGPKVAQRIVDFRKQNGPFKKIEELMKVKGIGEKTFARLKDLVVV